MHDTLKIGLISDLPTEPEFQKWDEAWAAQKAHLERVNALGAPCCMGVATREYLFKLIRAYRYPIRRVLDIGTFVGFSALNFALAGCEVVTVDVKPANAPDGHWKKWGHERTPAQLMEAAGVAHQVEFVTQDSPSYLAPRRDEFDLICIDGWHAERGVLADIYGAFKAIRQHGLIFMDDVQPHGYEPPPGLDRIDGPRRALDKVLDKHGELGFVPASTCTGILARK